MHACTQSVVKEQTCYISLTEFGRVKNIGVELLVRMKLKITYWKKKIFSLKILNSVLRKELYNGSCRILKKENEEHT